MFVNKGGDRVRTILRPMLKVFACLVFLSLLNGQAALGNALDCPVRWCLDEQRCGDPEGAGWCFFFGDDMCDLCDMYCGACDVNDCNPVYSCRGTMLTVCYCDAPQQWQK